MIDADEAGIAAGSDDNSWKIRNVSLISMMIGWIPDIMHIPDRNRLCVSIRAIVCGSENSKTICCFHGILQDVLKCVERMARSHGTSRVTGRTLD